MKTLTTAMVMTAALLLVPTAQAAPDAKDLVGIWVLEKGDAPKGATVKFTKDGKMTITHEVEGKQETKAHTYKLTGDTIEFTSNDKTETATIKELTKDKLVVVTKDKKELEFKKK